VTVAVRPSVTPVWREGAVGGLVGGLVGGQREHVSGQRGTEREPVSRRGTRRAPVETYQETEEGNR